MPSALKVQDNERWSREESSAVAPQETSEVATAQRETAPVPVLHQGAILDGARQADRALTGVGIALGGQVAGWLLWALLLPVLVTGLYRPQPIPLTATSVLQWMNFLFSVAIAVGTGYLVGHLAPRNGIKGLLIGRAIGFVVGTGWTLIALGAATGGSFDFREAYLRALPMSLFWFGTVTLTEVLIARWAALRR